MRAMSLVSGFIVCVLPLAVQADWDPDQAAKWVQMPDLERTGIDVNATAMHTLGDDFECRVTGPITDIHIWASWLGDYLPHEGDATAVTFTLSIYSDIPAEQSSTGYSMPGEQLWMRTFQPGDFVARIWRGNIEEGWLNPPEDYRLPADWTCWQYNFFIDPDHAFRQLGTQDQPIIYWLVVQARPQDSEAHFGWKTSLDHWNDDAVWDYGSELPRLWKELIYPPGHEMQGQSIDLAFVITTAPAPEELDFGDAPENATALGYPTTLINNGARHTIVPGVYMGSSVDAEPDGQPDPDALGDDNDGNDDEDGVSIGPLVPGQSTTVTIEASVDGQLNAWIDFDGNDSWAEAGNRIFTNEPLAAGTNTRNVFVPNSAPAGLTTYARFRFTAATGGIALSFDGPADNGEVEDYKVVIEEPPPVRPRLEFSLDIGSDTELSDPFPDNDEVFDPGDVYLWKGPSSPLPRNGFKDDRIIFGFDPAPDPFANNPVPVGTGGPDQYREYWDLDGHDQIDFSLVDVSFPILIRPSACIFPIRHLAVSYDDDMAPGWPAFDVPVTVPSPAGAVYGTTPGGDEVIGLGMTPVGPGYQVTAVYPIADEVTIHIDMAPNPDISERDDDDVDSLDIVSGGTQDQPCEYWLFSPDHEANLGLDPGGIYEVWVPLGGPPVQVIDEANLGLPEDTDIDAFELVWVQPDQGAQWMLALLFSVDNDDPLTPLPIDESGGLDPRMIYVSLLTGGNAPLLVGPDGTPKPLEDDIDALANWGEALPPLIRTRHWRSMRLHVAPCGELAVRLDPSKIGPDDATTEPRDRGLDVIEVDFNTDVTSWFTPNQVQITGGGLVQNGPDYLINGGLTLRIPVTGSTNMTCYLIDISNSVAGIVNDADCYVATLEGDTNGDHKVNALDRGQVKVSELAGDPATLYPRRDVNLDCRIDALDRGYVKIRELLGHSVVCP